MTPSRVYHTSPLLTKLPRELRDMIWGYLTIIDDDEDYARFKPHDRSCNVVIYTCEGESEDFPPVIRPRKSTIPTLVKICKQMQDEIMQTFYRKMGFGIRSENPYLLNVSWMHAYRLTTDFSLPTTQQLKPNGDPFDFTCIRRLYLELLPVQGEKPPVFSGAPNKEMEALGKAVQANIGYGRVRSDNALDDMQWLEHISETTFEPFSLRYTNAHATRARLLRSTESTTADLDLDKYDLQSLVPDDTPCFACEHSNLTAQIKYLFNGIAARGNMASLYISILVDSTYDMRGVDDFLAPISQLRCIDDVNLGIMYRPTEPEDDINCNLSYDCRCRGCSPDDAYKLAARTNFAAKMKKVETLIGDREDYGCNRSFTCDCQQCFPPILKPAS